jgi:hypothetical protein
VKTSKVLPFNDEKTILTLLILRLIFCVSSTLLKKNGRINIIIAYKACKKAPETQFMETHLLEITQLMKNGLYLGSFGFLCHVHTWSHVLWFARQNCKMLKLTPIKLAEKRRFAVL